MYPLWFVMGFIVEILFSYPRHHYELVSLLLDLLGSFGTGINAEFRLLLKFIHEIKLSQYWR
jgi:hypothetical protein